MAWHEAHYIWSGNKRSFDSHINKQAENRQRLKAFDADKNNVCKSSKA